MFIDVNRKKQGTNIRKISTRPAHKMVWWKQEKAAFMISKF